MDESFDYSLAFSRNIGWVTKDEQAVLHGKRVAIAGMGGVGGSHLLTLTRLGIGAFHIADFDVFELANFNRQAGASITHLNQPKVDVLAEMALDINPKLDIQKFPDGVTDSNLSTFLTTADLYVDGLDFFAFKARRDVFAACWESEIPAITAAPLGMGAALLNFLPGKMSFEQYFCLQDQSLDEQIIRFLLGLSPAMLQRGYVVDPSTIDLLNHRGPSTPMACELCAGLAATETLKILLQRGNVRAAPHGLQFDAYRNKLAHTWRPLGNRNPLQQLGIIIARKQLMSLRPEKGNQTSDTKPKKVVEQILDAARWAPSGDNTQPWRFEIVNDQHVVVHGFDTREHCVYDLQGHASQLALGVLLETLSVAASVHGMEADGKLRENCPETKPTFDVFLKPNPDIKKNPLSTFIPIRSVQRRAMKTRPLRNREKDQLLRSVGNAYQVIWLEGWGSRLKAASLMYRNAKLRLTMPEAFEVHKSVIEWNARFSHDKVPDKAVGLDPMTTRLMQWALKSWQRVVFLNTFLAGTVTPRIELDLIPGLFCAAHFVIVADKPPQTIEEFILAGRAVQTFWLTTTLLGLQLQPELTPLIFFNYVNQNHRFTKVGSIDEQARRLSRVLEKLVGEPETQRAVFLGRIGAGNPATARSLRRPLAELLKN